jgi:hypothetical protein
MPPPAYLFRRIAADAVTMLLDEADAIWKRGKADEAAEALRSIVNAGHRKNATVGRVEMKGQAANLVRFRVYAPVAVAGIGNCLPDTVLDRSVIIPMRRRAPDEHVAEYRERTTRPVGEALRDRLATWAATVADKVGWPWPALPARRLPAHPHRGLARIRRAPRPGEPRERKCPPGRARPDRRAGSRRAGDPWRVTSPRSPAPVTSSPAPHICTP